MSHITAMKDERWPYKVVFQRALLRAFASIVRHPEQFMDSPGTRAETASAFIGAMNHLVANGLDDIKYKVKKEMFWQGSGLGPTIPLSSRTRTPERNGFAFGWSRSSSCAPSARGRRDSTTST